MMARGFKPVGWVAAVAGAALSCYMLSLRVASERAELAQIEHKIVTARQDIRFLQTELGTRGRMQQLERWNADVLALSSPTSGQFLESEVTLARFDQREKTLDERATVQMASLDTTKAPPIAQAKLAPRDYAAAAAQAEREPASLVHRASYIVPDARALDRIKPAPVKAAPVAAAPVRKAETKPVVVAPAAPKRQLAALVVPAPAKKKAAPAAKSGGFLDDDLLSEIGATARAEKAKGGAARQ